MTEPREDDEIRELHSIEYFRQVSAEFFKGVDPVRFQQELRDEGPPDFPRPGDSGEAHGTAIERLRWALRQAYGDGPAPAELMQGLREEWDREEPGELPGDHAQDISG